MKQKQVERPLLWFLLSTDDSDLLGSLPLALQRVLTVLDSYTIVWLRFLVMMLGLADHFAGDRKCRSFRHCV